MRQSIPNLLTLSRLVAVPVLIGAFYLPEPTESRVLAATFILASLTDFLDGYLARRWQVVSGFGRFLDPIADKLMVAVALVMLTADGRLPGIHVIAAALILFREILISGLREFLGGKDLVVPVTQLAKWKTTVQMLAIAVLLAAPLIVVFFPFIVLAGRGLLWLSAVMTVVTGWQYLWAARGHLKWSDT